MCLNESLPEVERKRIIAFLVHRNIYVDNYKYKEILDAIFTPLQAYRKS
jgi:hypothetical protein